MNKLVILVTYILDRKSIFSLAILVINYRVILCLYKYINQSQFPWIKDAGMA